MWHTHLIMSQSVRTKNKPQRASGPPAGDPFWTGERLGKLETEIVHIKEDIAHIKATMATKADIQEMVTKSENRILRWIIGAMGTLIVSILGLIAALVSRLF